MTGRRVWRLARRLARKPAGRPGDQAQGTRPLSGRSAPGWVVSWKEGIAAPYPLSWTVLAGRQGQGSGQPASGWRTEGLCAQTASCWPKPVWEGRSAGLAWSTSALARELQDRADPVKALTRRVYSLNRVRGTYPRHPYKGYFSHLLLLAVAVGTLGTFRSPHQWPRARRVHRTLAFQQPWCTYLQSQAPFV